MPGNHFLSLDNYTDIIAISINKDKDVILNEVLSIIEHVWLTEDWLLESPSRVSIVEDKHVYYFHLLKDFLHHYLTLVLLIGNREIIHY